MSSPSVVQETRRSIQSAGYTPLPVLNGTKRAAEKGWQNLAKQNPPPCVAVNAWPDAASLSTGVFCGEIVIAIDIDVDNPTLAEQVFNAGIAYLGSSPMRYRDGSARRLLVYRNGEPQRKYKSISAGKGISVDFLTGAHYFVADGLHPEGTPYQWDKALKDSPVASLPSVTAEQVESFRNEAARILGAEIVASSIDDDESTPAEIDSTLPIPNDTEKRIAQSVLDDLCAKLAATGPGQHRNQALNDAALQMGEICAGWGIDRKPVGDALWQASIDNGYVQKDGEAETKATLESGFAKGWSQPRARKTEIEIVNMPFLKQTQKNEWPKPLSGIAYYGIPGEFTHLVAPQSEGDPAALLLAVLTIMGTIIGRNAYLPVGASRHHGNLFACVVAETSKGRKGTVMAEAKRFAKMVDPTIEARTVSGLSSGEGLIEAIRDPREEDVPVKEGGRISGHQRVIVDTGVLDKRLLVTEGELGNALQVAGRDGNTLSATLRLAWDGEELRTLARSNKNVCMEPHVSIFGNITIDELQRLLTATDRANGFGNRFLWCCARRSGFLPFGGQVDQTALHNLAMKTAHRVVQSQHYGIMGWFPEARQIWTVEYERLSGGLPGLTGAMCARAEAQTLRLALVYAVLDGSRNIAPPHLIAALEVWRYCEDSVRFIFGSATGDSTADEIARMLKNTPEGATLTQISSHFGRNKSSDELSRALNSLKTAGRVSESRLQTGGRPSSVWILTA